MVLNLWFATDDVWVILDSVLSLTLLFYRSQVLWHIIYLRWKTWHGTKIHFGGQNFWNIRFYSSGVNFLHSVIIKNIFAQHLWCHCQIGKRKNWHRASNQILHTLVIQKILMRFLHTANCIHHFESFFRWLYQGQFWNIDQVFIIFYNLSSAHWKIFFGCWNQILANFHFINKRLDILSGQHAISCRSIRSAIKHISARRAKLVEFCWCPKIITLKPNILLRLFCQLRKIAIPVNLHNFMVVTWTQIVINSASVGKSCYLRLVGFISVDLRHFFPVSLGFYAVLFEVVDGFSNRYPFRRILHLKFLTESKINIMNNWHSGTLRLQKSARILNLLISIWIMFYFEISRKGFFGWSLLD